MSNVHNMKIMNYNFIIFQPRALRSNPSGVIDPMQVDAPPEENDNNEEELYEVDIDSFVRTNIILRLIALKYH